MFEKGFEIDVNTPLMGMKLGYQNVTELLAFGYMPIAIGIVSVMLVLVSALIILVFIKKSNGRKAELKEIEETEHLYFVLSEKQEQMDTAMFDDAFTFQLTEQDVFISE